MKGRDRVRQQPHPGPASLQVERLDADSAENAARRCNGVREEAFYSHEPGVLEMNDLGRHWFPEVVIQFLQFLQFRRYSAHLRHQRNLRPCR